MTAIPSPTTTPLKQAPSRRLRLHYCTLKAGQDVGVGEVGAGFRDFSNQIALVQWLQEQTQKGLVVAVYALRVL